MTSPPVHWSTSVTWLKHGVSQPAREYLITADSVRCFAKLALVRDWYLSSEIEISFISSPKTLNFVYLCKIQSKGGVMGKKTDMSRRNLSLTITTAKALCRC